MENVFVPEKNISAIDLMQAHVGKYALYKKNSLSCYFPLQMFRFEEILRKKTTTS